MSLRLLFAGTPDFAVPALRELIDSGRTPLAVLTQPDRGAGRGRKVQFGPVKQLAVDAGIDVLQPERLRPDLRDLLASFEADLLITAAYGLLLPQWLLDLPRFGCWNLHASLLPRWRGASPINQAILHGDRATGITLMQMEAGLDTGPILAQSEITVLEDETAGELHDRLSDLAGHLELEQIRALEKGRMPRPVKQDDSLATHAPLINREDARLDWSQPARVLARKVRGYNPWPVAFAEIEGIEVRIYRARPGGDCELPAGQLVRGHGRRDAVIVACAGDSLEISELQAPGKKRVSASDWLNAHPDWR
ncbi:MAG: methionyl-tRNA formyltransferase [Wenzhouxiangella sp.]|jgi:methionyl-tRNA formyltransferase|nr:methionyl-tRNA formyltransferase [Wenzhouxiangella sp.]